MPLRIAYVKVFTGTDIKCSVHAVSTRDTHYSAGFLGKVQGSTNQKEKGCQVLNLSFQGDPAEIGEEHYNLDSAQILLNVKHVPVMLCYLCMDLAYRLPRLASDYR